MFLPKNVLQCMQVLEQANFKVYAVGGCVRDALLGLQPHDYDLCTNASTEEMAQLFSDHTLVRSGEKHGTVGVVVDKEVIEITTFRTEGGYVDGRHPDWVRFVDSVQEDLARRDFTINAMAYNPSEGYVDPFGGEADLKNGVLRTVGTPTERFSEDALRILRGVRFAVRYALAVEPETQAAMEALAPTMEKLARERVFEELCKLLPLVKAEDLLRFAPILTQVLPELAPCVGFLQHNPHHLFDVYTHTAHVVEATSASLALRWAALLHDCGKPDTFFLDENGRGHFHGHAQVSAEKANDLLLRLKAPTTLRERVVFLIDQHMTTLAPDKRLLRRWLGKHGKDAIWELIALQQADFGSKGVIGETESFDLLCQLVDEVLAEEACLQIKDLQIGGRDLQTLGFPSGPLMGKCLAFLLEQVQDERIANEKLALLDAAAAYLDKEK